MKKQAITFFLILVGFASTNAQSYPEMITVEGGTFTMGDVLEIGHSDERPAHSVTLKTFSIATTETTVLQWRTYCNATGRKMPEPPSWGWIDSHPIVNVNWDDAVAYCDYLSHKTGKIYRLPTEAEWEYAARGGKASKGFEFSGGQNMDLIGWCEDISTNAVMQKKPNELGLYDMSGNAREWCQDWYGEYDAGTQTNPIGVKSEGLRVLRGGGWNYDDTECSVSRRFYNFPVYRSIDNGFRVVAPE